MKLFIIFWLFVVCARQINGIKLNYPRVLLPIFEKLSINFTLEVIESGCFKWTSSRPDLISITPIFDDIEHSECTSKAVVTTLSREKRRNTAFVLAEDLSTGEVLRCDVILDVIDQLGVLTTTRELYLEEAPETFELWALDSQGNAFTTLEGIEFNWKISSQNPIEGKESDSWQQVLRFLRFSESKYHDVPRSVEKFDRLGLRGYMVLLEGINTGSAKVSVHLPYSEYSHIVSPIDVNIMVLANIILDPSDVHILVGDSISFKILQLKQGKLQDITHNTQYYLEVENSKLASIRGSTVTGNVLGRTSVILKDRNVAGTLQNGAIDTVPTIRATVTISRADKLIVNLLPYYNWVTVEGERHTIGIDLYTNDNQLITMGPKYTVDSEFDESIFYKISKTVNGSRIYGETLKTGSSAVIGAYEKLKAKAELQVYKKIDLRPLRVVLPFDPNHPKRQQIQYTATGGDGSFEWSSLTGNLISISHSGLAETKLGNLNELHYDRYEKNVAEFAQIKVALQRNNKISKTADVLFLPPAKLEIVRYNFETALKDYIFIHVALYALKNDEYIPFTACDNLHFEYKFADEIFYVDTNAKLPDDQQLHESACHLVALRATSLGNSPFTITYKFSEHVLRDEVNLVVFDKLDILNPLSNEVVLPIGSARNVIYQNGPQKVFNMEAELTKNIQFKENVATITTVHSEYAPDKHIFNILCTEIGSTQLTFEIYNTIASQNHVPYVSKFVTKVHCVKPRFINLYTTEKLRESCPLKVKNSLMHVKRNDDQLEVGIEVLDAHNRKLMNITSLVLDWKFAQSENGHYDREVVHKRNHENDLVFGISVPRRDYLTIAVPDIQNSFKIKATVINYDKKVLSEQSITPEYPEFGIPKTGKGEDGQLYKPVIENELSFLAVNSTLLPYDTLSIFLASDHKERVHIVQGSGFYEIKVNEEDIVNVFYDEETKEIVIEPLKIGQVQIDLIDRCLMTDPSHLFVAVVSIGRIEIQVPDRIERTKSVEALVKLYDSLDGLLVLDGNNLQIYQLHEHIFNPHTLAVTLGEQINLNIGEIRYTVTGLELGETKLVFNSGYGDKTVSSAPATIQVFPPLRLYPRNSTVIVGSSIQIYSHGGPYPDVGIVYTVQNENIVSTDSSILTALRLGETIVTGRCVGINPINGQQIVFSEDQVQINVVPLDQVKIKTPLVRIRSGAIMPATIWGVPNISPMILGTLSNMKVKWSTNQPDVIDILGIFSDAGIEYDDIDSISVRIKALKPGKAKIRADVVTPNGKQTCYVEVTVFQMLELESPKRITTDAIIVPPKSQINLKANLPDVNYKFAEESIGGLKVSADGILKTNEGIGRDLIIATSDDQTLSIPIEIKNVHYILATLHTPAIKLKQSEKKLPSGMNIILKVSLHDNLGNEFSHNLQDASTLSNKLSQKDEIGVNFGGNFTIAINLPRETSNMLSISLKETVGVKYDEDFIKLSVSKSNNKFPTKTIFSVGDIICFDSPLATINNWITSDDSIIRIDQNLGIGRVIGSRSKYAEQVTITNGNLQSGHIKYDLEIREADKIEFYKTNDIFNGKNYKGHLVIKNHLQLDKISNVVARNLSTCTASLSQFSEKFFSCNLRLLNEAQSSSEKILKILKTTATFDKLVGAYACEIDLLTTLSDLISLVKDIELNFELVASLSNGISSTANLRMVPAINVFPQEISIEQLDQQIITITGLDKVLQKIEITTTHPKALQIMPTIKSHGSHQYKIKVLKPLADDESIAVNVYSPLTIQTVQIPIYSSKVPPKCLNQPFQSMPTLFLSVVSNFGLIISAVIVLSATIWAFIYCFSSSSRPSDGLSKQPTSPSPRRKLSPAEIETFSPFQKPNGIATPIQRQPTGASTRGPLYPTSPFLDLSRSSNASNTSSNFNQSGSSPVYGDSTLLSPNKRINRRYL